MKFLTHITNLFRISATPKRCRRVDDDVGYKTLHVHDVLCNISRQVASALQELFIFINEPERTIRKQNKTFKLKTCEQKRLNRTTRPGQKNYMYIIYALCIGNNGAPTAVKFAFASKLLTVMEITTIHRRVTFGAHPVCIRSSYRTKLPHPKCGRSCASE